MAQAALEARVLARYEPCGCPHRACRDPDHFESTEDAADVLEEDVKSPWLSRAVTNAIPSCCKKRIQSDGVQVSGYQGMGRAFVQVTV
eukprot:gene8021-biopygen7139